MGYYKRGADEFNSMPEHVILDFEQIFWKLRRDVTLITPMTVDWDAFFQQFFAGVAALDRGIVDAFDRPFHAMYSNAHFNDRTLVQVIQEMVYGDALFENNTLSEIHGAQSTLERVFMAAGLKMKEHLLDLLAYRRGHFPYSYRTMISDGCLLFSKNESIYDTPILDSQY